MHICRSCQGHSSLPTAAHPRFWENSCLMEILQLEIRSPGFLWKAPFNRSHEHGFEVGLFAQELGAGGKRRRGRALESHKVAGELGHVRLGKKCEVAKGQFGQRPGATMQGLHCQLGGRVSGCFSRPNLGWVLRPRRPRLARRFLVNTFAGFALERAPRSWPQEDEPLGNFYEA